MHKVIRQDWLESERGWGCRPDGYSLHKTIEDLEAYVKIYWETMPALAPDEYSRPDGDPFEVEVDSETFESIKGKGKRFF